MGKEGGGIEEAFNPHPPLLFPHIANGSGVKFFSFFLSSARGRENRVFFLLPLTHCCEWGEITFWEVVPMLCADPLILVHTWMEANKQHIMLSRKEEEEENRERCFFCPPSLLRPVLVRDNTTYCIYCKDGGGGGA